MRAGHISSFCYALVGAPTRRRVGLRRAVSYVLLFALLLPVATAAATYPRYRAAMQLGREGLTGSYLTATYFGDVEYADQGSGATILLVHGAGGGYDRDSCSAGPSSATATASSPRRGSAISAARSPETARRRPRPTHTSRCSTRSA
jgi:hypothetical protein